MDKQKSRDLQDIWMMVLQFLMLTAGFLLTFTSEAEIQQRIILLLILVIAVLLYPMPDRLNDKQSDRFLELQKDLKLVQLLQMELRDSLGVEQKSEELGGAIVADKAESWQRTLDEAETSFSESFEKAREDTGAYFIDFFEQTIGAAIYLIGLVGGSALVAWLIIAIL